MSGLPQIGRAGLALTPPSTFSCAVFWVVIIFIVCDAFVVIRPLSCGSFLLYRAAWPEEWLQYTAALRTGKGITLKQDSLSVTRTESEYFPLT